MAETVISMDFKVMLMYYKCMESAVRYVLDKEVIGILDHFTTLFNVRIAIYSKEGQEIAAGLNAPTCSYCRLIREGLGMVYCCLEEDERNRKRAAARKRRVSYLCHAGLLEAVYPIYVYNSLIGYIMMGQCRTAATMPEGIANKWIHKKGKSKPLEAAFSAIPLLAPEKINSLLEFFELVVRYSISNNLVALKNNMAVDVIVDYIRNNLHTKIGLIQAARIAGRSPTTITHLIKRVTGKSFKQLLLEMKLDEAERLLKTVAGTTVAEAAERCGFEDQFYFSRIFKKYKKIAPSLCKTKA